MITGYHISGPVLRVLRVFPFLRPVDPSPPSPPSALGILSFRHPVQRRDVAPTGAGQPPPPPTAPACSSSSSSSASSSHLFLFFVPFFSSFPLANFPSPSIPLQIDCAATRPRRSAINSVPVLPFFFTLALFFSFDYCSATPPASPRPPAPLPLLFALRERHRAALSPRDGGCAPAASGASNQPPWNRCALFRGIARTTPRRWTRSRLRAR